MEGVVEWLEAEHGWQEEEEIYAARSGSPC